MNLIHKNILRDEMPKLNHKIIITKEVCEKDFKGIVSLFTIISIDNAIWIKKDDRQLCIADVGYKWLQFSPENENWWLTVVYNSQEQLVESYFDITKENILVNKANPKFIDMFLDVVFSIDDEPVILDEDELKSAVEENLIRISDYEMAILLAKRIVNCYNRNKAKYYKWVDRFYKMLR